MTGAWLADTRAEVRALWESVGWCADCMTRPAASELERCVAVCDTLRTHLTGPDGRILVGSTTRLFVMVGFCGGYTTFSSLSLQTLNLIHDGEFIYAGLNIAASVVLCLLAVWIGHAVAAALGTLKWI